MTEHQTSSDGGQLHLTIMETTWGLLEQILHNLKVTSWEISPHKVHEVAHYFLRDIDRLESHQEYSIAIVKFAAYWAFWIRKLKPVIRASIIQESAGRQVESEIGDINERLAIDIAVAYTSNALPKVRNESCDGMNCGQCFNNYAQRYFEAHDRYYYHYLVYSLGKRTFGPHHLSSLLDLLAYASCSKNYPPPATVPTV